MRAGVKMPGQKCEEAIKSRNDNQEDMRTLDTSGAGFKGVIDADMLYIDKTLLVDDILRTNPRGVYLYTRPRRFGKSTNLTMLQEFFDIRSKGTHRFDGFEISKPEYAKYDVHRNAYNVIKLNLKSWQAKTFDSFINAVELAISGVVGDFEDSFDPDRISGPDARNLKLLMDDEANDKLLQQSLYILCKCLYRSNGLRTVILIDEYDAPVIREVDDETRRSIMDFLSEFLSAALKDNEYLQLAVLTGIFQIAKESMFSNLNNVVVNNILSKKSDERYGFTESEVRSILEEAEHPERFDDVKDWYDGYRFGNAEVYCPYSIVNYVLRGCEEPKSFSEGASADYLLRQMLFKLGSESTTALAKLLNGETIEANLSMALTFDNLTNMEGSVFSLLAMSGYLNAKEIEEGRFALSVPNKEKRSVLKQIVSDTMRKESKSYEEFCKAVMDNDVEAMRSILERILLSKSALQLYHENAYGLVVSMILDKMPLYYDMQIENEDGNGRSDIKLTSKDGSTANFIFELKRVDNEKDLEPATEKALRQIHDRRYYAGMKGDVILYGISFWSKFPCIKSEVINMERDWEKLRPAPDL